MSLPKLKTFFVLILLLSPLSASWVLPLVEKALPKNFLLLTRQTYITSNSLQGLVTEGSMPFTQTVIHVNPRTGSDNPGESSKTEVAPYKTITSALKQAQPGTIIQLAPGSYTSETGEDFPLTIKQGVTLQGDKATNGQNTAIIGSGQYLSPTFARQNVTVLAEKDSTILGVTITNPNVRGTGLWIESSNPVVKNSTFSHSHREGIFLTGRAAPLVEANVFTRNSGNGISVVRSAGGEIRNNLFQDTGFGLAIGGSASPLVVENQIRSNVDGIVLSDTARPVLRNNTISSNERDGIVIAACSQAKPDLGTSENFGGNTFSNNGQYDIHNGGNSFVVNGNQSQPSHIAGSVSSGLDSLPTIFQEESQHCW